MKKIGLMVFLFAMVVVVNAQDNITPYTVKTFSGEKFTSSDVRTSGGNITFTATSSEPKVEAYVKSNNGKEKLSKEEIQQRLAELYDFDISVKGNKLIAIAKPKEMLDDWKKGLCISFKVFVPASTFAGLSTSGGNIMISGTKAGAEVSTSGGNIDIENVGGRITGSTSGGNINITNSNDDVDLSTSGGNIIANKGKGNMRLSTSGGNVELTDLDGRIRASTSGGNIEGNKISGDLYGHTSGGNVRLEDLTCSVDAATSGGDINVSISKLVGKVKLNNHSGDISLTLPRNTGADLDISGDISRNLKLEGFDGRIQDKSMRGKLNGGGVSVFVDAGSNRVSLDFK